jgi:hypothetical protein
MAGFYDVENLGDFKVTDIPTREDMKQSLEIAKQGPRSLTTTQRNNLTIAGQFKVGAVIYNSTVTKFEGFAATGPSTTGTWAPLN